MEKENQEKIKKGLYLFLCIISLGLLCAFPFISKSCSSEESIKNIDKSFSKLTGDGYMVEYPSNALTIFGQRRNFDDLQRTLSYSYFLNNEQTPIINNDYDLFGLGITNYFRFTSKPEYANKFPNYDYVFCLEFYIEYGNNKGIYPLSYFNVWQDTDDNGNYLTYEAISYDDFKSHGLSVNFNAINLFDYDVDKVKLFNSYIQQNTIGNLFNSNYKFDVITTYLDSNFRFVNIMKYNDVNDYQEGYAFGYDTGYDDGYGIGYNVGFNQGSSNEGVFSMLKHAAISIQDLMNIEVLPNISLWLLISIPLAISIMLIMFKLLRGGN